MTRDAALTAVWTFVSSLVTLSGSPAVIWAHQTGNGPSTPHIRLTVVGEDRVGRPRRIDDSTLEQSRTMDVQIDSIGTAAIGQIVLASAFAFGDSPAGRALAAAGLAVQAVTPVVDLPEKGPSGWVRRKSTTVTFGYTLTTPAAAGAPATAVVVSLQADTDGDGAIEVDVDPLITVDPNP